MKHKKTVRIFLSTLVLVLILVSVNALGDGYKPEDYKNPNVYQNPDFYKSSNPSLWDFKLVNYKYVDFSRKDIYTYQAFFDNLPDDKFKSLNYKLIDNYDLIADHRKIDGQKYINDLGCSQCAFAYDVFGKNNNFPVNLLTYSKNGMKHMNGDFVSIPGTYTPKTLFIVQENSIIAEIYKGEIAMSVPESDSLVVRRYLEIYPLNLQYRDKNFKFDEGDVQFKKGDIFIPTYSKTNKINDVNIIPGIKDVRLFFDGIEHKDCSCAYVSTNTGKKVITTGTNEVSGHKLEIKEPFIRIQGQPLALTQNFGTTIIENRDENGLIPRISMKFEPLGYIASNIKKLKGESLNSNLIEDGAVSIYAYEDGITKQAITPTKAAVSNPLVLSIENTGGQSLIGTRKEPQRLIIDSNNKVASIKYGELSTSEQTRLYFSLSEDTRIVGERARQASARKEELKAEIQNTRGVAPMVMFGYVDDKREEGIILALKSASENSGLRQDFLTASLFQEGLNVFIDRQYYNNPEAKFPAMGYMYLLDFGAQEENLKKNGFLRKDFNGWNRYTDKNELVQVPTFDNVNYAIEAATAVMAERKSDFLQYARSKGYDTKKLNEDQVNYWTYLSFNCGKGCMRDRIEKSGIGLPNSRYTKIEMNNPDFNSKRVLATTDLIKKAGLFDKTISENINAEGRR